MKQVALIIPCYNEAESLEQLFKKLQELKEASAQLFKLNLLFVDDGSQDRTAELIQNELVGLGDAKLFIHKQNKNLGGALKTGIQHKGEADYIGFLDSDCTYDPLSVIKLFKALEAGADLATLSPYHPKGAVVGVPAWRLSLSWGLSSIYKALLSSKISTYTAMVRMAKADRLDLIMSDKNDFTFVAEMLIKAIRLNYRIVEIPAVLSVRKFGASKMNIIKTIKSHFSIITRLLWSRDL